MKTPRPPGLLVLAVLAAHLLLGREVQRVHDGWLADAPAMPPRIQVAWVREMQLRAPPPPARPAAGHLPRPVAAPPVAPVEALPEAAAEPASAPPAATAAASAPSDMADDTTNAADGLTAAASAPDEPVAPDAAQAPDDAASAARQPDPTASGPADAEPGPEWPLSTRLTYVLTGNFRGPVHGQAQVEWLRQGRDYQVHLDVSLGPSFAPLVTRRMSSQGLLTPDGIAPQRYDEETRLLLGERRRASVFFLPGAVQLSSGAREPAPPGGQDAASQFVQLTWLFLTGREPLRAGQLVKFPLVLPRRQYAWQYEVTGEETLATPMGPVAAWHLRPSRPAARGDLTAEVWLAPALQYLPLRLVIRQDAETYIDLMLRAAPLQAAPESTHDTARRRSQ